MIELAHVSKHYRLAGETIVAVRDASVTIGEGELVAVTGPSGSGKSTLLHLIGGLDRPDEGRLRVADQELARLNDRALSRFRGTTVGFVFQFFHLQPYLTVEQNVAVPLMIAGVAARERLAQARAVLADVGLGDRANHLPGQLSGGQQQRAAIARALVNRPKVLLADEPTGNLDQAAGAEILRLLQRLNREQGVTIVLITHNPQIAAGADRIIEVADGRVRA